MMRAYEMMIIIDGEKRAEGRIEELVAAGGGGNRGAGGGAAEAMPRAAPGRLHRAAATGR